MEKYQDLALSHGAIHAVSVAPDDIVFDGRSLLKCMFGCGLWGKGCTCPSRTGALSTDEWEKLLRKYKTVLVIHTKDKETAQTASFNVERQAYLDGDVMAFSMSDCALCPECAGVSNEPCRNARMSRPSFHSVGIDVFATAHKLGFPLKPLKELEEEQNWYAAVWLN